MTLLKIDGLAELRNAREKWIGEMISAHKLLREKKWTESIAVGSQTFVENVKALLVFRL
jgi:putative transposase